MKPVQKTSVLRGHLCSKHQRIAIRGLFIAASICFSLYLNAQDFSLKCSLEHPVNGVAFLRYVNGKHKPKEDSCILKGKFFEFTGTVPGYIRNATLTITYNTKAGIKQEVRKRISLENKKISISISGESLDQYTVKGNLTDNRINYFYNTLYSKGFNGDSLATLKMKVMSHLEKSIPDNFSTYLLYDNIEYFSDDELTTLYDRQSASQKNTYFGYLIKRILDERKLKSEQIGTLLPDFNGIDFNGDKIYSINYTDKGFVILDFWASWCHPCREDVKKIAELIESYKKLGIQVISISTDADTSKWKNAVLKDSSFKWTQLLDPAIVNTDPKTTLSESLKVWSLPSYFIVNPQGKIIFRADGFDEVNTEVKKIFIK